jgi:Ca2+-binding RTX toxin-like protein
MFHHPRFHDLGEIIVSTAGLDLLTGSDDIDEILAAGGVDDLLFGAGADANLLFGAGADANLLFGAGADANLLFGADPDLAALSNVVSGSDLIDPVEIAGLDIIGVGATAAQKRQAAARAALARRRQMQLAQQRLAAQKKQQAQQRLQNLAGIGIKPTLAVDTGYTKARRYPFGLQADAATAAGTPGAVTRRPQTPIKVQRLVIPTAIAPSFVITDIKVGKDSQLVGSDPIPAEIFAPNAVNVELAGATANVGHDVTIAFANISGAAALFRAVIIGPAVE